MQVDIMNEVHNIKTISESDRGVVFKAIYNKTNQPVIIRLIYNSDAHNYRVLKQNPQANISPILAVVQDGNDSIILEEFIQGITLDEFLAGGAVVNEDFIVNSGIQLCTAMAHLHSLNIIHRDIKPANIILNGSNVHLIDFDAARTYNPTSSADTVHIGTKGYAAPEQYGFAQTDARTDIYSFGVVLKELLPYAPNSQLIAISDRCVAFDPSNRYQSANALLADLSRFIRATPAQNPLPAGAVIPKENKISARTKKIIGYALFALFCVVILAPQDFEVTFIDYILSKMVYLSLVVLLLRHLSTCSTSKNGSNYCTVKKHMRYSLALSYTPLPPSSFSSCSTNWPIPYTRRKRLKFWQTGSIKLTA